MKKLISLIIMLSFPFILDLIIIFFIWLFSAEGISYAEVMRTGGNIIFLVLVYFVYLFASEVIFEEIHEELWEE